MGAPIGNKNAAGSHKGWYGKSKAKKNLTRQMSSYVKKQRKWTVASNSLAERKKYHQKVTKKGKRIK